MKRGRRSSRASANGRNEGYTVRGAPLLLAAYGSICTLLSLMQGNLIQQVHALGLARCHNAPLHRQGSPLASVQLHFFGQNSRVFVHDTRLHVLVPSSKRRDKFVRSNADSESDAAKNDIAEDDDMASPFFDLGSSFDDGGDDEDNVSDEPQFRRDQADMLEEREDRFYVDEQGNRRKIETCVLVGVEDLSQKRKAGSNADEYFTLEESLIEMHELVKTAGMDCTGELTQRLNEVNPKTYIGSGKVKEALALMEAHGVCTIVFDAELTPGQQKALENAFNQKTLQNDFLVQEGEVKVIDRTALILDIFAQHAKTREAKLQVELALHEYRKPRLTRMWTHLERQSGAGGVGLRGPGERQLEIDKRLLRDRINTLRLKIDEVQSQRALHRRGRDRIGLPTLSLCGYTNAGKSSLQNYLTKAGVLAEEMLFATVDPTTRKVKLPGLKTHPEVLMTDTVGFIQKLPTHLVAAFRATLEEVKEADVLVHVIDVANPMWKKQERSVLETLQAIDCANKPIVRVLNKIDLLDQETAHELQMDAATQPYTVAVSALHGDGMQDFVAVVEDALAGLLMPVEVLIPYSKGDELNAIHEQGNVDVVDYREAGTYVRALVPESIANRLLDYNVGGSVLERKMQKHDKNSIEWIALGRGRHESASL